GIGADEMVKRTLFGRQRINPSADLDEKTLTEIAKLTGGQYFRARNQQELQNIYQKINELEPVASDFLEFRPEKDLFYWPLGAAFSLLFMFALYCKLRGSYDA
ncbi:MAG: Ca-activated chloride channel family protein, partial [Psychromonas sp.]